MFFRPFLATRGCCHVGSHSTSDNTNKQAIVNWATFESNFRNSNHKFSVILAVILAATKIIFVSALFLAVKLAVILAATKSIFVLAVFSGV